jgi:rod shape-determining protein MreD
MRLLELALGFVTALVVHAAGSQVWPDFPQAVDVLVVVVVLHALGGRPASSLLVGLVAGLVTDALTSGLYGLHGFADTIVGYGGAVLAQRLAVRRLSSVMFLLALAAAVQQAVLVGLAVLLMPGAPLPGLVWVVAKVASATALGAIFFQSRNVVLARFAGWRRRRGSRLR